MWKFMEKVDQVSNSMEKVEYQVMEFMEKVDWVSNAMRR